VTIGWYNGWSPEERTATNPVQQAAIRSGRQPRPTSCSVCGCFGNKADWRAIDAVWFHNERYDRPLDVYPICRRCHWTLHSRFDDPQPWLDLVARYGRGGTWFELLSLDPRCRFQPFAQTYPEGLPGAHNLNNSAEIGTNG
jgi:hypothetical protein